MDVTSCPRCGSELILGFTDMPGARPEFQQEAFCERCGPAEVPARPGHDGEEDGGEDALLLGPETGAVGALDVEALMPVCGQCARRLSQLNGIGGQLLWVCSQHGATPPDWVPGPAIPRTVGFPPAAPEAASRPPWVETRRCAGAMTSTDGKTQSSRDIHGPIAWANATDMKAYSYRYTYGRTGNQETTEPVRASTWAEVNGETTGIGGHNLSGYRWRGCRCAVCVEAKARSSGEYRERRRAKQRG